MSLAARRVRGEAGLVMPKRAYVAEQAMLGVPSPAVRYVLTAAVTNQCKLGYLRQQKILLSQFWRLEVSS